jgi:hypothetical protein
MEKQVGPGSKSAVAAAPMGSLESFATESVAPDWNSDPNKGRFGGSPVANGRVLTAKLTPAAGPNSAACKVLIEVKPATGAPPISGTVHLYLHPTFGQRANYSMMVENGVARDEITSYGAFTIGVKIAEAGKVTPLELNLCDVPGGTKRFYAE